MKSLGLGKEVEYTYLDCNDIANLTIVSQIGHGAYKNTYVVELPSGNQAVAKRCRVDHCHRKGLIKDEASIFRGLYEQYGNDALHLYGECYRKPMVNVDKYPDSIEDFSIGHTMIMELGKPLSTGIKCYGPSRRCFTKYFTDRDLQDLISIAHQYARYAPSPLLLAPFDTNTTKVIKNDNSCPQQYVTRLLEGKGEGRIFHADHDQALICKDHYANRFCTKKIALKVNCDLIKRLTYRPHLKCEKWKSSNPNDVGNDHINGTLASEQCKNKFAHKDRTRKNSTSVETE